MGPTQVCYNSKAIEGQGVSRHPEGFSRAIRRFKGRPDKASYNLTPGDLRSMNLIKGQRCKLELSTGFKIEGTLNDTLFIDRKKFFFHGLIAFGYKNKVAHTSILIGRV